MDMTTLYDLEGTATPIMPAAVNRKTAKSGRAARRSSDSTDFRHNEFAEELIEKYHIIEVNGVLYVYRDGYYQADDKEIEQCMIEMLPTIKQRQRAEVLSYIKIKTHKKATEINANPYIINCENTRLDVRTGERLQFTPDAIEFARLPVKYDPSAECPELDATLKRVFCGDDELIRLFEEVVGYCLIKHAKYQVAVMLVGSGSNGKSTIIDLIKNLLGPANYSALALEQLTDRFNVVELDNKLANLGDDIDNVTMRDEGQLKRIFAGNTVKAERKGEQPYMMTPYATCIFSGNEIPRSRDKSYGFYRRWVVIPFNARFTPDDPDYDPMLLDKLTTPEATSCLLNKAIEGAQRLVRRGKFDVPQIVKQEKEQYIIDNSATLQWIEDEHLDEEYFLTKPRDEIYDKFSMWALAAGMFNVPGRQTVYKEIRNKYDFAIKPKQHKSDGKRYFVKSI